MVAQLDGAPWSSWVKRLVIHTTNYLDFDGNPYTGGRQRHVRDLALVARDICRLPVVIVQKGHRNFETVCPNGFGVVGAQSRTTSIGDPKLGRISRRFLRPGDGLLYESGEDAWPYFVLNAKAIQHGIWWDYNLPMFKRVVQRYRMSSLLNKMKSILCVDTNFINWVRCEFHNGIQLAEKCKYIPNYADLKGVGEPQSRNEPHSPLQILFARRFEPKRGTVLFLDALVQLRALGESFKATMLGAGGARDLSGEIEKRGLKDFVQVGTADFDEILKTYGRYDVSVVPTIWSEGTSFACVESICAGVPVVATNVGGLGNLVIPGHNGFVTSATPGEIARAIQTLRHPETWRQMRENCLRLRDAFSMDKWSVAVASWLMA
jgi:glycosyltransferase involved in cell wall biosynthesis